MPELSVEVIVRATPQQVWDVVFDWPRQGEWILGTSVAVRHGDGRSVGSEVGAYTGRPPMGFLDTFVITEWSEPHRCEVVHTGTVVRGTGIFSCRPHAVRVDRIAGLAMGSPRCHGVADSATGVSSRRAALSDQTGRTRGARSRVGLTS